jgi:hypothetical protein
VSIKEVHQSALNKNDKNVQEVVQSIGTISNEADVTNLNPPSPFLFGHVKKKKKNQN